MEFVFDADVISTFAKIERLYLLAKIFGKNKLLITPSVYLDLSRSKSYLVRDINTSKFFQHATLSKYELDLAKNIHNQKKLGIGESECISLCKVRGAALVTNDNKAIEFAEGFNINVANLETILLFLKSLVDKEQLTQIINDIETKDKVIIVNKEDILN